MSIGRNIRRLRELHHEKQDDIAKLLGVTYSAVSHWERGTSVPRMSAIDKLAKHWQVSKSAIIEGSISDSREEYLLGIFRSVNTKGKQRIIEYAEDVMASGNYQASHGGAIDISA